MEDEEEVKEIHVLEIPRECCVPELCQYATATGMPCQHIFQRAYRRTGCSDTLARTIFVQFISTPQAERVLPRVVVEYCASTAKKTRNRRRQFCSGCMLTNSGMKGLSFAYGAMFPEGVVTAAMLAASGDVTMPALEKSWLDLLESGVFDENEGGEFREHSETEGY